MWNHKGLQIAKITLKENKAGEPTLPDCKITTKLQAIKMVWCWQKDRHADQWTREPRNKPVCLWSMNFDKCQDLSLEKE